jgi:hypothetical protein
VRGFIAITDPGWYERLAILGAARGPMDANFWRPSARRIGLATGTPFLLGADPLRQRKVDQFHELGFGAGIRIKRERVASAG